MIIFNNILVRLMIRSTIKSNLLDKINLAQVVLLISGITNRVARVIGYIIRHTIPILSDQVDGPSWRFEAKNAISSN